MSKEKKRQPAAYAPAQRSPTPEHRRSRGVAVLLAVVLGLFGAHLFYLGYRRRGLTYLLVTLASVGACFVAIPIAQTVQGNPFGGVIVGLAILLLGSAALIGVYLSSLLDAVHILTNDTQPRDGAYYPRSWQTRPELTDTKPQANPR